MVSLAALIGAAAFAPAQAAFEFSPAYGGGGGGLAPAPMVAPVGQAFDVAQATVINGFGEDVPLEFAVQQIVPPDMDVSWGPGVDRSARVNWQGGQPWPQVLATALSPAGLEVGVGYGIVEIRSIAVVEVPVAPVAAPIFAMDKPATAKAPAPANSGVSISGLDDPDVLPAAGGGAQEPALLFPMEDAAPAAKPQGTMFVPMEADASAKPMTDNAMAEPVLEFEIEMPEANTADSGQMAQNTGQGMEVFDVDLVEAPVIADAPMNDVEMVPAVSAPAEQVWNAESGTMLRGVLQGWATNAGWAIAWQSDLDYPLMASAAFVGSFEDAARALINAFAMADPPVMATLYRGNNVIVVTTGAP